MTALVLGGSVFVGRCLVDALLAAGHDVAVLNRGRTATDLPPAVERITADRTDAASMAGALGGRDWDAVYDVSGFVMVAGGGDIAALLDQLTGSAGHYVYVSSIMAYDQSALGVVPWTEDLPTDPSGPATYGGFKAVAERAVLDHHASTGRRSRSSDRPPSTARATTSTTWRRRCSCGCSTTVRCCSHTAVSSPPRTATSTTCAS